MKQFVVLLVYAAAAFAQLKDSHVRNLTVLTADPANCTKGETFINSTLQTLRYCKDTDTWTDGGVSNYRQTFTSQTSVVLTHNQNSSSLTIGCYDDTGKEVEPNDITLTSANTTTVTFASAQTGACVVNASGAAGVGGGGGGGSPGTVYVGTGLTGDGSAGDPVRPTGAVSTHLSATGTLTFGTVTGQGPCIDRTISLPGAVTGDVVMAGPPAAFHNDLGFHIGALGVSAADTVYVRMCKLTTGNAAPTSDGLQWRVTIVGSF